MLSHTVSSVSRLSSCGTTPSRAPRSIGTENQRAVAGVVRVGTLLDSGMSVVNPEDGAYEKYTPPDHLADRAVTNICFGGEDLRTAHITCSISGRLIACRWSRPGLPLAF